MSEIVDQAVGDITAAARSAVEGVEDHYQAEAASLSEQVASLEERATSAETSLTRVTAEFEQYKLDHPADTEPEPEPEQLLFGANYGGGDETYFRGRPQVARCFFTGNLPADIPANQHFARAYSQGIRTFVLSWKGTQTDTQLNASLASLPDDCVVYGCYFHEPEDNIKDGSLTLASWRARTTRDAGIMRQHGVIPTVILMQWTVDPKSGRNVSDYYLPAGVIDVFAFDYYPDTTDANPELAVTRMEAARAASGCPQMGIGELGVRPNQPDNVTMINRTRTALIENEHYAFACYWSTLMASGYDSRFTAATADAWFEG